MEPAEVFLQARPGTFPARIVPVVVQIETPADDEVEFRPPVPALFPTAPGQSRTVAGSDARERRIHVRHVPRPDQSGAGQGRNNRHNDPESAESSRGFHEGSLPAGMKPRVRNKNASVPLACHFFPPLMRLTPRPPLDDERDAVHRLALNVCDDPFPRSHGRTPLPEGMVPDVGCATNVI